MKKSLFLLLSLIISLSTYSQVGKGYIIIKEKTQIFCDKLELAPMETWVKCWNGAVEKKYKMKELHAFTLDADYHVVDNKGSYIGRSVMENKKYLLVCLKAPDRLLYFIYDREHVELAKLPKGKKAAALLLTYFGECPEAKTLLEKYHEESQKAVFDYQRFFKLIADYNATTCKNQ
jgi:hypothetical protein